MRSLILFLFSTLLWNVSGLAKEIVIHSPDHQLQATITCGSKIFYSLTVNDQLAVSGSDLALVLDDGTILGSNSKIRKIRESDYSGWVTPEIKEKKALIPDLYHEVTIDFKENFSLDFRLYNSGLAYRFRLSLRDSVTVIKEYGGFEFLAANRIWFPEEKDFNSSNETPYLDLELDSIAPGRFCYLPALVKTPIGPYIWLGEANVWDYPGLWLEKSDHSSLMFTFPGYPDKIQQTGSLYSRGSVLSRKEYLARIAGNRALPWRIAAVAEEDIDLLNNQMVYLLSEPCRIEDVGWIKPGWVILDWWARRNIFGVDFKAGINTQTAKYFIDFCADYGITYFLLDDGWVDNGDLLKINPELDMPMIMEYAKQKGVQVMVWLMWSTLNNQMTEALDLYQKWGIGGVKVDFMNRDDQLMMRFYERVAQETAKRRMVVNFHGSFKPNGLRRAYPNILTREGMIELEQNGWIDWANPDHHCLLPFIRNVSGPVDYIPGSLNNATKNNFRPVGDRPMEQGTRAHAMALAVILESPMQMVPDAPSDYYANDECSRFLFDIPTTWDETLPLKAIVGDFVIMARRQGEIWYLSAITDWTPRQFTIQPDFLGEGNFVMECFEDGINADTRAIDYRKVIRTISAKDPLQIHLAPGGGFVAKIYRK